MPRSGAKWLFAVIFLHPRRLGLFCDGFTCQHCQVNEGFGELLKPQEDIEPGQAASNVHILWPTHVEVVPLTEDIGGWLPASFHQKLASEAVRGWQNFRDKIGPGLPRNHELYRQLNQKHAGALNDAFFHYQKRLFEAEGDFDRAMSPDFETSTPPPDANSSWPDMNALPEYNKLRKVVERLSRRYLTRSGMASEAAAALNYSVFNWAAVHGPGEFHGPHTHVGEYHVGVFYAQAGDSAGKLRFGDPRGHSPPFGRSFFHSPRSGDLVFFPSWLSHMATVTAPQTNPTSGESPPLRVVFSFNIGPVQGPMPCHVWWSDPTGDMRFSRKMAFNPEKLGL